MFEGKVVREEETANHQGAIIIMSLLHHLAEDYGMTAANACLC